jgi:FtsP/CotA-like multicopper oxidase with cupredoxin domain
VLEPEPPRATRIPFPATAAGRELWMGGTASLLGEPLYPRILAGTLVVDCAGELPPVWQRAAGLYLPCVFSDLDATPAQLARLEHLAQQLAETLRGGSALVNGGIARVCVLCQVGMNRSGLLVGLTLRVLGAGGEEAIAVIRRARPGALSNETFARLIRAWQPFCPR